MHTTPDFERLAEWTPQRDEPVFAGHFPGNPLLPGALLIDWAVDTLNRKMGWATGSRSIRQAKFLSPARPNESLVLACAVAPRGRHKLQVTARRPDGEATLILELLVEAAPENQPRAAS